MKEENEKPELGEDGALCPENTKPAKPIGMGINAYCPCKDGVWGEWIDPHIAS